jgi:hypothetical protein
MTIEPGFSFPHRPTKHRGRPDDTNRNQQALTEKRWFLRPRSLNDRSTCHRRPSGAFELRQRNILIESDRSSVGAYLRASVKLARHGRHVAMLERLKMAPGNLRFVRDLFER